MLNIDDRLIKEISPKIKPNALSVLLAIAIHLNKKNGQCFPSHSRLMALTGLGRDSVYNALDVLKEHGLLKSFQSIDKDKKVFGRRVFKLTTRFIKIFIDAEDAEPLPELPDTVEPDTVEPDTDNQEAKQLNKIERIKKEERINKERESETKNPPTPPESSTPVEEEKEKAPPVPPPPPAPSFPDGAKTVRGKNSSRFEEIEIPESLQDEKFLEAWGELLKTSKWKKKEPVTLSAALKQLSRFHVLFATQLCETATANGWQGVVFDKTAEAYERWKKPAPSTQNSYRTTRPGAPNSYGADEAKYYEKQIF